ncbi:hypothetical protein [Streptomyces sp. NPDC020983]|uniref:hypothetical protein n=1 Tax=Streptomyces sp. NPDC020983 TaxID=3365106 RepID=UPI0037A2B545
MPDDPRDDNRNDNVVSFRSRSGASPGLPPIPGGLPPAPPDPPPSPPTGGDGEVVVPSRRRRSAAESLAALDAPLPPVPGSGGAVALRSEGVAARRDDDEADGPGVAALGLAATLAIALAALRGTVTVLTDFRERRQERAVELAPLREARLKARLAGVEARAKHQLAMQDIGGKSAQSRVKTIPSSQEYGRKALGGGSGSLSGSGGKGIGPGGTGPGRNQKSPFGSGGTSPGGRKDLSPGAGGKGTGPKPLPGSGGSGKNNSPGSGIKSPSDGKSPSSHASSPAMERARGRQERAAARQGSRAQLRADRQAARLALRGQDRDADRDRKNRAADARQDTKDRVRNARVDAKEGRKEQARQDRFAAKQKDRKDRNKARRKKREGAASADADRTTLGQATVEEARRRLNKRRKNPSPPVLTTVKRKKSKKDKDAAGAGPKVDLTKPSKSGDATSGDTTPKVDLTKKGKGAGRPGNPTKPKPGVKGTRPGRKKARVNGTGSAAGGGPAARRKARRKDRARRASERTRASHTGADWDFYTGPRYERRSAADSIRDTDPQQQETWTAEPVFPAGYHSPGRDSLTTGARGLPAGTGSPSITITKEAPVGSSSPAVQTPLLADINPEHATEVTLDDVIDLLDKVVSEAFATHDECVLLSAKATELMYELEELSVRLAAKHNVIGTLTAWAMQKLAESMEVLSRKAEEMSVQSLLAAETCETAKTEMDDAYRPITQATADAGLRTPSARVHNEN